MPRLPPLTTPNHLATLARAQGRCVTIAQARRAGVSSRGIALRVAAGTWSEHMGCLVLPEHTGGHDRVPPREELDGWAVALRYGIDDVAISGSTALALGGRRAPPHLKDVLIARLNGRRHRAPKGVSILRRAATDLATRRLPSGLVIHRPTQALLDILQVLDPEDAIPWIEWGLHSRFLGATDIRRVLGNRAPRVRRSSKGATAAVRLAFALKFIESGTRSEAESLLRSTLRRNRIRGFRRDWPVSLRPGSPPVARLDCAHPGLKLALEVDGRAFHSSAKDFEHDRERQNILVQAGWTVLRFTWRMLNEQEARVVEAIRHAMAPLSSRKSASEATFRCTTGATR